MKKLLIIILGIYITSISIQANASSCSTSNLETAKENLEFCKNMPCGISLSQLEQIVEQQEYYYNECIRVENYNTLIEQGNSALKSNDYSSAIKYFQTAKKYADSSTLSNLNNVIGGAYFSLGNQYFDKKDYTGAIDSYKNCLTYLTNDAGTLYNIGVSYYNLENYALALEYLSSAKNYSKDASLNTQIDEVYTSATKLNEIEESKKHQKTNDPYNYLQYYLSGLNIYSAREKLTSRSQQVIIAVIDDGININHPDLTSNIRTNTNEIPGNNIDDDNNGYTDDYNGRNFVKNTNSVQPEGKHGTMVAGIIGANINNNEGIAGIVPNVKLMPLIVGDTNGDAGAYNIIKAIEYAIKNGANIINISLGGSQFSYTNVYSEVFKIAHDKGIVIVVAAGNGDELSENSVGVNTTVNKVSPVCDETNKKIVIGVGALGRDGKITPRSNYGDCIDVYAYGEEIYTTTIKTGDTTESGKIPYEGGAGTSFSTPMIAGIIGLGFNIYGKIAPDIVYDALIGSIQSTTVNAAKYLDNLSAAIGELSNAILRMHEKGLTIHSDPSSFKYDNGLRRDEAAKFFVQYARVIMKMKPDYTKEGCSFNDLNEAWDDLQGFVVESCQLGLFKGSNGKFNPASKLTNAQAITVFMRLIGGYLDESGAHYASRYYVNAFNMGLISGTALANRNNFDIEATRGDVALMLYRGAKK